MESLIVELVFVRDIPSYLFQTVLIEHLDIAGLPNRLTTNFA